MKYFFPLLFKWGFSKTTKLKKNNIHTTITWHTKNKQKKNGKTKTSQKDQKTQTHQKETSHDTALLPFSIPYYSKLLSIYSLYTLMTRDSWPRKHKTWQDSLLLTTNGYVCQNWRRHLASFSTFNKNIPPNDLYERTLFFLNFFILFLLLRLSFLFITFHNLLIMSPHN